MNTNLLASFFIVCLTGAAYGQYRVCYFTSWGDLTAGELDMSLCSHVMYAFVSLDPVGQIVGSDDANIKNLIAAANQLKEHNSQAPKILLSVAGGAFNMSWFSVMVSTPINRMIFINSTIYYLRQLQLDGIDLDFEYPGSHGSAPGDKQLYTTLLQEMRSAFTIEAASTGKQTLLMTAAVAAGKSSIDAGYEIAAVCDALDFVNLMAYDYHGSWESVTGHNAPLFSRSDEANKQLNVQWTANYWVSGGCPKNKVVIGIPFYGRWFTLVNGSQHDMGAPAMLPAGTYKYSEICSMILRNELVRVLQPEQMVPYAYNESTRLWIGYDDLESVEIKVRWLMNNSFAGFLLWSLEQDDFSGTHCGQGRFPLLRKMNDVMLPLLISSTANTTITTSAITTATITTTNATQASNVTITETNGQSKSSSRGLHYSVNHIAHFSLLVVIVQLCKLFCTSGSSLSCS